MDVNPFYTTLAAATATLLGLLFVAIQINLDRLMKEPSGQWRALAVSTFQTYVLLLIVSLFTFLPPLRALVIWISAGIGIVRQLRTWLPVWRLSSHGALERLLETIWLFVAPALMWAWAVYWSTRLQNGRADPSVEINIASALIILLVIVLRNSWRLLFQIPREAK